MHSSSCREEDLISDDREVNLISDVISLVPDSLKKLVSIIEEVVETNKETLSSVYQKIEKSGESIEFIYVVIEYALQIRSLNVQPLQSLHCLLSKKYGKKKAPLNENIQQKTG